MDRRDVKALSDDELRERGFNEIDIGLFRSGHSSRIDIWIEGMNDPLLSSVPRRTKMTIEDNYRTLSDPNYKPQRDKLEGIEGTRRIDCVCGVSFFTDSSGELNCVWDSGRQRNVACCPNCAALEED